VQAAVVAEAAIDATIGVEGSDEGPWFAVPWLELERRLGDGADRDDAAAALYCDISERLT
jgi:hypothetical protein